MDLSKFSDQDLDALEAGDLSKLSDAGLDELERQQSSVAAPAKSLYTPEQIEKQRKLVSQLERSKVDEAVIGAQRSILQRMEGQTKEASLGEQLKTIPGAVADFAHIMNEDVRKPVNREIGAGYAGIADLIAGNGLNKSVDNIKNVKEGKDVTSGAAVFGEALGDQVTPEQIALQAGFGKVAEMVGPAISKMLKRWGEKAALNAAGVMKTMADKFGLEKLDDLAQFLMNKVELGGKELPAIVTPTNSTDDMLQAAKNIQQAAGKQLEAVSKTADAAIKSAADEATAFSKVKETVGTKLQPSQMTKEEWLKAAPRPAAGTAAPSFERMLGQLKTVQGTPGVSQEGVYWPIMNGKTFPFETQFVYRTSKGSPVGILRVMTSENELPNLEIAVDPLFRRQGVATKLYEAAKKAGIDVEAASGSGGYTDEGALFAYGRRAKDAAKEVGPAIKDTAINLVSLKPKVDALKAEAVGGWKKLGKDVAIKFDAMADDLTRFIDEQLKGPTDTVFSDLSDMRTRLGKLTNFSSETENNLALQQVYGAMSDVLKDAATKVGGTVSEDYLKANLVYHQAAAVVAALEGKATKFAVKDLFAPGAMSFIGSIIGGLPGLVVGAGMGALSNAYGHQAVARGLNATAPLINKGIQAGARVLPVAARAIASAIDKPKIKDAE